MREKAKRSYANHRESRLKRVKEYYEESGREKERGRVRERAKKALEALGGECRVCGRKDSLSIDHVMDDGAPERLSGSKDSMIRKILLCPDREKYQILCHNHNQKKQVERARRKILEREDVGAKKECPTCGKTKGESAFHGDISDTSGTYYECSACTSERRDEVKARAIAALGGKCSGCQEKDVDMLSIDHVDPVGKEREGHGQKMYRAILAGLIRRPVQVLCFNCNQGKGSRRSTTRNDRPAEAGACAAEIGEKKVREYELKDLRTGRESRETAIRFLERHHYDGYGRHAKRCYSASMGEEVVAVVKMCSVTRQGTPRSLGLETSQVMELDRMAVAPEWRKKNLLSWFLSRVMKMVREDFPEVKKLVSFADGEQGHDGAVYRAANWKESGKTAKSYYYVSPGGERVKKKTFFDRIVSSGLKGSGTESEAASKMGMRKVVTRPKTRFTIELG